MQWLYLIRKVRDCVYGIIITQNLEVQMESQVTSKIKIL